MKQLRKLLEKAQRRSLLRPMFFNLKTQVCHSDLLMSFYIYSTKLTLCSLKTFGFVLFLAAKTLVTLSSKEKESLGIGAGPSASGMGVDSAFLEPGTRSYQLLC
jgi:hypothetical protein